MGIRGAVVIPVHNEAVVLPRCLSALAEDAAGRTVEVVVVANACTDNTAAVARSWADRLPGLTVVETETPGKANALNLGDEAVSGYPRIYLDGDIVLRGHALSHLLETLSTDEARVAAPKISFDTTGADPIVQKFYSVFAELPYASRDLVGLGVYAMSRAGRRRFNRFPDVTADDLFVQHLFSERERIQTAGEFVVTTPRRWRDLVKVRIRAAQGSRELANKMPTRAMAEGTTRSTARALLDLVRRDPAKAPAAVVYVMVTVAARLGSSGRRTRWHRDESSRSMA
jgi:glycosyltransferase involved in cell wall biosynthesis